jgi:hypothetical protein
MLICQSKTELLVNQNSLLMPMTNDVPHCSLIAKEGSDEHSSAGSMDFGRSHSERSRRIALQCVSAGG